MGKTWLAAAVAATLTAMAHAGTPELTLEPLSIADLTQGHWRSSELTAAYLHRIETIDKHGLQLHAVIEVAPDALASAQQLDRERRTGHLRGALHGVPILLKDNIDTGGPLHTTAGSLALVNSQPGGDAFIAKRLREAGAVILGKTNLSEWANYRSRQSSSGWSGRGGQTRNPYGLNRNPCGSSSGSGVAVAANLAMAAVGTETDGSIVCPAAANGIVGLKPTLGLVSRSGIIPIAASQDTAGPMARSVADAAALLNVLAGYDPDDPATAPLKDHPPPDFRAALRTDALKGVRIGVLREFAGAHEQTDLRFNEAIATLRALGATIIDPVSLPTKGKFDQDESTLMLYEFKDGINRYLATRRGDAPADLAALIAFNQAHRSQEMPFFGQDLFIDSQLKGPLTDPEYLKARDDAKRLAGPEGIDAALSRDHLDVLIAPTMGPAWLTDHIDGDHVVGGDISSAPAVAGYPHITVPMGEVDGLPVGLSFVASAWSDAALLGYAYAFEQATHHRRPPPL
jgi:amidase